MHLFIVRDIAYSLQAATLCDEEQRSLRLGNELATACLKLSLDGQYAHRRANNEDEVRKKIGESVVVWAYSDRI